MMFLARRSSDGRVRMYPIDEAEAEGLARRAALRTAPGAGATRIGYWRSGDGVSAVGYTRDQAKRFVKAGEF